MVRACLSGDPACTGIAPCTACARAVNTRVLPKAMVAAGFNGSVAIAQRFFEAYKDAMVALQNEAPSEMVLAMRHGPPTASSEPAPTPEPENEEEEEVSEISEDELSSMGRIEDVVDDVPTPPATLSRKKARLMARRAKNLKAKRAKRIEAKEDTHG